MLAEKSRESELLGLLIKAKIGEAELSSDKLINMVWDWRIHQKNPIYSHDPEYIQADKEQDEAYEKIKQLTKNDRAAWDIIFNLDSANGTKLAIANDYYYKSGIQDGINALLNLLKLGSFQ